MNIKAMTQFSAFLILCFLLLAFESVYAQEGMKPPEYRTRFYYLYEMGNSIPLSDFELGSTESIKDSDGNGFGASLILRKGEHIALELDGGNSRTVYQGSVEDGVNVTFQPQTGSDFEVLSSSKNIIYDFDLMFQNPYAGLNVVFNSFRIGGGRIFQKSEGEVILSSQNIEIARATYETKTQSYFQLGFEFEIDFFYFAGLIRSFEAPSLKIISCNEAALGTLVCSRIKSAAGNRNLRTNNFGEFLLNAGFVF